MLLHYDDRTKTDGLSRGSSRRPFGAGQRCPALRCWPPPMAGRPGGSPPFCAAAVRGFGPQHPSSTPTAQRRRWTRLASLVSENSGNRRRDSSRQPAAGWRLSRGFREEWDRRSSYCPCGYPGCWRRGEGHRPAQEWGIVSGRSSPQRLLRLLAVLAFRPKRSTMVTRGV